MPKMFSQKNNKLVIYLFIFLGIVKEWLLGWIGKSNLSSLKRTTIWLMDFPNPQYENASCLVGTDEISFSVFQEEMWEL